MSSSSLIRTLALGDKNKPYVAILHPNFLKTSSITVAKPIFFPTPLQWGCIYATSLFIGCIKNIIILLTTFSLYFDSPSSHYSFFPFFLSPTPLYLTSPSLSLLSLFLSSPFPTLLSLFLLFFFPFLDLPHSESVIAGSVVVFWWWSWINGHIWWWQIDVARVGCGPWVWSMFLGFEDRS